MGQQVIMTNSAEVLGGQPQTLACMVTITHQVMWLLHRSVGPQWSATQSAEPCYEPAVSWHVKSGTGMGLSEWRLSPCPQYQASSSHVLCGRTWSCSRYTYINKAQEPDMIVICSDRLDICNLIRFELLLWSAFRNMLSGKSRCSLWGCSRRVWDQSYAVTV